MAHDKPMLAKAEARYMHISAQKARLVIDMIRGRQAGDAINILGAVNKRIAPAVEKLLRSAIANAENKNQDVDVDRLIVTEAYVNEVPRQKRIRPAPMGRAFRYQRRMAHIVIMVAERKRGGLVETADAETPAPRKLGAAKKTAAKKTVAKKSAAKNWKKAAK